MSARLAQLVEQTAVNRWVAGSSPASSAIIKISHGDMSFFIYYNHIINYERKV